MERYSGNGMNSAGRRSGASNVLFAGTATVCWMLAVLSAFGYAPGERLYPQWLMHVAPSWLVLLGRLVVGFSAWLSRRDGLGSGSEWFGHLTFDRW
ncbi:MAG: hypothetical protein JOY85_15935 [Acidobacteriaceae bacterium]|nr:hypothetical protein [Acidobacteriaceae bacterium]